MCLCFGKTFCSTWEEKKIFFFRIILIRLPFLIYRWVHGFERESSYKRINDHFPLFEGCVCVHGLLSFTYTNVQMHAQRELSEEKKKTKNHLWLRYSEMRLSLGVEINRQKWEMHAMKCVYKEHPKWKRRSLIQKGFSTLFLFFLVFSSHCRNGCFSFSLSHLLAYTQRAHISWWNQHIHIHIDRATDRQT